MGLPRRKGEQPPPALVAPRLRSTVPRSLPPPPSSTLDNLGAAALLCVASEDGRRELALTALGVARP